MLPGLPQVVRFRFNQVFKQKQANDDKTKKACQKHARLVYLDIAVFEQNNRI